jgi:hypothetical protein
MPFEPDDLHRELQLACRRCTDTKHHFFILFLNNIWITIIKIKKIINGIAYKINPGDAPLIPFINCPCNDMINPTIVITTSQIIEEKEISPNTK